MEAKEYTKGSAVEEKIRVIMNRLLETRPREQVVLRPYMKNVTQHAARNFWAAPEHVDLRKLLPEAEEGQACFVCFHISSKTEEKAYLKISGDVDVYLNEKKIYSHEESREEFVWLPICVREQKQAVSIKCYCRREKFAFDYLISSNVYPFMWAVDYLVHIKRTLPFDEYREEEGIAVSGLYPQQAELPAEVTYIFPKESRQEDRKDFAVLYPESKGCIGYAYAVAAKAGCIVFRNESPIKIMINGVLKAEKRESTETALQVEAQDRILVKCIREAGSWSFSCPDELLEKAKIRSDRKYGDRWLMIGGFGQKREEGAAYGPEIELTFDRLYRNAEGKNVFWRLQDGSYIRPYLDSFFFGQWFYALMVGHWGIWKAAKLLGEKSWQEYFTDSIGILGKWFEYMKYDYEQLEVLTPFLQRSLVLDHLDPLGTMGMNLAELYLLTGDQQVKNTVYELRDALYERVPRMENGIICRVETMWSDDLFMGVPFLVRLGRIFHEEKYDQDAFLQLKEYYHKLFMKDKKIFSHIFFVKDHEKSNVAWGRGNGWVMVAMCEYLDHVPTDDIHRQEVEKMYREFAAGICALQGTSGLWHQVLDREDTYEETSCTAMFLYGLLHGIRLGILERKEAEEVVHKAYEGLCRKAIDSNGNINGVCMGSGCSRDWKLYADLKTIQNDDHATGIVLAAFSEYAIFQTEED